MNFNFSLLRKLLTVLSFGVAFSAPLFVLAAPFAPGETLDPGCAPGSANCYVVALTVSTTTQNFGIGTSSPYAKLSVVGQTVAEFFTATSTTATSTFPNIVATQSILGNIIGGVWQGSIIGEIFGGTGQSGYTTGDMLYASGANTLAKLGVGSNGQVLKVVGGIPQWGTDISGGGGAGLFSTTSDQLAIYPSDTTDVVIVGGSATTTTGNILEVIGNTKLGGLLSVGTSTLSSLVVSNTSTSTFAGGISLASGCVSVAGVCIGGASASFSTTSADYWDTTKSRWATTSSDYYLTTKSTTNLAEGGNLYFTPARADDRINATTSIGTLTSAPNLGSIGTVTSGVWNASLIGAQYGGTGSSTLSGILKGNGTGVVATAIAGTDYVTPSVTTLSSLSSVGTISSGTWNATTIATTFGGTGLSAIQANALLLGNGAGNIATTSAGTNGQVLALVNGVPTWQATSTLATITGVLGVTNGGTNSSSLSGRSLLWFDGTSIVATSSALTVGSLIATTTATSTFVGGLSANIFNATSATASSTFANGINLSSGCYAINGVCVGAGSGSVNTGTYGSLAWYGADGTIISATSTRITVGSVNATSSLASTLPYASTTALTISGTAYIGTLTGPLQAQNGLVSATSSLSVIYGGTGITNPTAAGILLGSYAGGSYQQLSTSTLGLLTTNVAEGSNLYYLDTRVQSFVHASTTIPKTYTANTFTSLNQFTSASSSLFSVTGSAYFGATATSSFSSTGALTLASALGISSGGTNSSSIPARSLLWFDGTSITATSSALAVGSLIATTSTATSTFAGGVTAGSGALFKVLQNGQVAIGASIDDPSSRLTVGNQLEINGNTPLTYYFDGTNGATFGISSSADGIVTGSSAGDFNIRNGSNHNINFATNALLRMTLDNNGNLGIGTSSPYSRLTVVGTTTAAVFTATSTATSTFAGGFQADLLRISSTTASSTFANGINLTGGCYSISGVCVGGSSLTGAGSPNTFAYWTTSGNLSATGTPTVTALIATSTTATSTFAGAFSVGSSSPSGSSLFTVGTSSDYSLIVNKTNGRVGVGTSSPVAKFAISGQGTDDFFNISNGSTPIFNISAGQKFSVTPTIVTNNGIINYFGWANGLASGVNGTGASYFTINPDQVVNDAYVFRVQKFGSDLLNVMGNGYVGIGTSSPYAQLAVAGTVVGQNFISTSSVASTFPYASSTAISVSGTASTTALVISNLGGSSTRCLQVNADGSVSANASACGTGGGGGSSTFSTTTSQVAGQLINAPLNSTDILVIGSTATTSGKYWFDPNSQTAYLTGNVGIGSTSPYSKLSVAGSGVFDNFVRSSYFISTGTVASTLPYASTTALTSSGSAYFATAGGSVGIGTTSPYARLSVVGQVVGEYFTATSSTATSTFNGGLSVGGGNLAYDFSTGVTSINSLEVGALNFDTDAGQISWVDLPVVSAGAGLVEGYTASIDDNPLLSLYSTADGAGGVTDLRVAIGTSTPSARLSVWGSGTGVNRLFELVNNASTTVASILDNGTAYFQGNVGIGTTSPYSMLSVAGTVVAQNYVATGTGASTLPYASTTALTVSGNSYFPSGVWNSSGFVGVGTTSPSANFEVYGATPENRITFNSSGSTAQFSAYQNSTIVGGINAIGSTFTTVERRNNLEVFSQSGDITFNVNGFTTEAVRITSLGKVGIGTTSPYSALSVVGTTTASLFESTATATSTFAGGIRTALINVSSTTASSTFANGINLTSGCYSISGVCVGGSSLTGAGVAGALTYWTASGTVGATTSPTVGYITATSSTASILPYASTTALTVSGNSYFPGSSIWNASGNVGIGTTSPAALLELYGTTPENRTTFNGAGNYAQFNIYQNSTRIGGFQAIGSAFSTVNRRNNLEVFSQSGDITFNVNNFTTEATRITSLGNVGIGTSSPYSKLSVWGSGAGSNRLFELTSNSSTTLVSIQENGTGYFLGNVGIGTTSPYALLSVAGTTTATVFTATATATSTFSGGLTANILNISSTTASSTFANGINLTSGCYSISGVCVGGSSLTGAGSPNTFAYWTTSGNLSATGTPTVTALIATSTTATSTFAGFLAIGTSSPYAKFSIDSASSSRSFPLLLISTSTAGAGSTTALIVDAQGNVGVGTSTPGAKFSVAGAGLFDNYLRASFFSATSSLASTLPYASTTALTISGTAYIGTLTGPLQAQNGLVSATSSLSVIYGGTGITNPTAAGILLGSYAGGSYQQLSTSTLGLLTTNVAEGSNLYYLDTRVQSFVHASTTIPKTYTANTFTSLNQFTSASSSLFSVTGSAYFGATATSSFSSTGALTLASALGISSGGTNSSSIPARSLLWFDGTSITATSSTLTVGSIISTTTATSTFTGGIQTDLLRISSTTATSTINGGLTANSLSLANGLLLTGGSLLNTSLSTSTFGGGLTANILNISSTTASSTFANGINLTKGCFAVSGVCIGSGSGAGTVSSGTYGSLAWYAADGTTVSATSTRLTVGSINATGTQASILPYASTTALTITGTGYFGGNGIWTSSGSVGIGTTSPYAKLSVVGQVVAEYFTATSTTATSTFNGGLNVGNGNLVYDLSTGVTSIASLETGSMSFETNAGVLTWVDLPVTSAAATGTIESYSGSIGGVNLLTLYGESDGMNGVRNLAVGIGTSSPYAMLSVAGTVVGKNFVATSTSATSTFAGGLDVGSGNLVYDASSGITSISSLELGSLNFDTDAGQVSWVDLPVISATAGMVEGYTALIDNNPLLTLYSTADGAGGVTNLAVGIGTTSPYAKLSVAGTVVGQNFVATSTTSTTTLAGGLDVGNGNLVYDLSSGVTSINALELGSLNFDTNAGQVSWADLPVSSLAATGTVESYTAQIGATPVLTVYGESDGMNGVQKQRVAVGTTTPYARLSVWGAGTGVNRLFELVNNSSTTVFSVLDNGTAYFQGNVGIGTTSPYSMLSVAGTVVAQNYVATGTTASILPYASSTAFTVSGSLYIDSLNGPLQAVGGVVSSTSTLSVFYGGTGTSSIPARNLLWFDGTSITATSSTLTVGRVIATTTLASILPYASTTALTVSGTGYFGNISVNGTSSLAKLDITNTSTSSPTITLRDALGNITLDIRTGTSTLANVFIGQNSGYSSNVIGQQNVALGYQTLNVNTNSYNTAIGSLALTSNTTGLQNTAVGASSMSTNQTGQQNTAMGYFALYGAGAGGNVGDANTAIGHGSLQNNSGAQNTGLGFSALSSNRTGSYNTALGAAALYFNVSATNTVAVGYGAGIGNASGYSNQGGTYVGYGAGTSLNTGSDYNTLLGYLAGGGITTGSNNIWIGSATSSSYFANLTTGSQNILIGNNISLPSPTASGQLNIGNIIFGTGVTSIGTTSPSGNIGIGTSSPYAKLSVVGQVVADYFTATTTATSTFTGGIQTDLLRVSSTTATSTFANGINLTGGCLSINGTCQTSSGTVSSGTYGSLAWYSANGTAVSATSTRITIGSLISTTTATSTFGGSVGIGSTTPYDSGNGGRRVLVVQDLTNDAEVRVAGSGVTLNMKAVAGSAYFGTQESASLVFQTGNTNRGVINSLGNFGIGTTTPYSRLSVWGAGTTASSRAFEITNNASTTLMSMLDSGTTYLLGNVGIGTTSPYTNLSVAGQLAVTATSTFYGSIGIGSTSPVDSSGGSSRRVLVVQDSTNNAEVRVAGSGVTLNMKAVAGSAFVGTQEASNLFLQTGNSNRLLVDSTGNIAIGTSSAFAKLDVFSLGGTLPLLSVASSSNGIATSSFLYIGVNGNVGFGSTSPLDSAGGIRKALVVQDTTNNAEVRVAGSGATLNLKAVSGAAYIGTQEATSLNFQTGNINQAIIDSSGNFGVATSAPWRKFSVTGTVALSGLTSSATGNAVCITTTKDLTDAGGASCIPSSIRFKENVEDLSGNYALDTLDKLHVVSFDYKNKQPYETNHSYGVIAEDVENIDKNLVDYGYDGQILSVHFEKITGLLVKGVQEQQKQIAALDGRVSLLESYVAVLASSSLAVGTTTTNFFMHYLDTLGTKISQGIASFMDLFATHLTVGNEATPTAITVFDKNGKAGCMTIDDVTTGAFKIVSGKCGEIATSTPETSGGVSTSTDSGSSGNTQTSGGGSTTTGGALGGGEATTTTPLGGTSTSTPDGGVSTSTPPTGDVGTSTPSTGGDIGTSTPSGSDTGTTTPPVDTGSLGGSTGGDVPPTGETVPQPVPPADVVPPTNDPVVPPASDPTPNQ